MANFTYTDLLTDYQSLSDLYAVDTLSLNYHGAKRAVFGDSDSHNKIIMEGHDLAYDGEAIVGGTIDEIHFTNRSGADYVAVVGADFNAERLFNILENKGVDELVAKLVSQHDLLIGSGIGDAINAGGGDDVIKGKLGKDIVEGGKGDDTLIGGPGSDTFVFNHGDGKDIIADFDAVGGGDNQDYIRVESMDNVVILKSGDDTVVHLSASDTITLVDVARHDVTHADFQVVM